MKTLVAQSSKLMLKNGRKLLVKRKPVSDFNLAKLHPSSVAVFTRDASSNVTPSSGDNFVSRHIGPCATEEEQMLKAVDCKNIEELISKTIPSSIRFKEDLKIPEGISEYRMLQELKSLAQENKVWKSYIGMGYYDTITPPAIQRNILENSGWVTQYTPYQAEIAQGRLESLLNFQTMICEITGLQVANASLLDESTACAEAMTLCYRYAKKRRTILVDRNLHPQNLALINTRAQPLDINVKMGNIFEMDLSDKDVAGVIVQYPNTEGSLENYEDLIKKTHDNGAIESFVKHTLSGFSLYCDETKISIIY